MSETTASNALKHGAYREILILPGENPAAFEELKQTLFAEHNVSGRSEETTMTSIAKAIWQLQRLGLYEHVQHLRVRGLDSANRKGSITEVLNAFRAKYGMPLTDVPTVPDQPAEKTNDELLLELGKLVTLDHLDKELDVENKLQARIDRLFKRFYQIKAMKSLAGSQLAPGLAGTTPVLELSATDASKALDVIGQATECETTAAPI
jgi:hypothetical protein